MKEKCHILIVEDQGLTSRELQVVLERAGYPAPDIAMSGEDAIRIIESSRPDLILMDIRFSNGFLDGVEAARLIRLKYDIPVIYLTGSSDEATLSRAKATDPFGYLVKPVHSRELLAAIEMALHRHLMEKKVKLSFNWLTTALNSIAEGIIATNSSGITEFMNPMAGVLTGWDIAESLGKPVHEVMASRNESMGESIRECVERVLSRGQADQEPYYGILQSRNGQEIPIHCSISPIADERGVLLGVILIFRNITELQAERESLRKQVAEAETQKRLLERYFPENLVDLLVDEGRLADLGGQNLPVTVMFCDIRNSTGIAELLAPADFARLLSEFFSGIMDLTYANGGSVNKLLGDGLLITFGCPIPDERDAVNCVNLALEFREYIQVFNELRPAFLSIPISMGIGISTGTVFAGNIGSSRHMEYTVLGNSVNTASRLEKLTKNIGFDILIDKETYEKVREEIMLQSLGYHNIRGRTDAVEVFFPSAIK